MSVFRRSSFLERRRKSRKNDDDDDDQELSERRWRLIDFRRPTEQLPIGHSSIRPASARQVGAAPGGPDGPPARRRPVSPRPSAGCCRPVSVSVQPRAGPLRAAVTAVWTFEYPALISDVGHFGTWCMVAELNR